MKSKPTLAELTIAPSMCKSDAEQSAAIEYFTRADATAQMMYQALVNAAHVYLQYLATQGLHSDIVIKRTDEPLIGATAPGSPRAH
jgi:hypothetical protein